MACCHKFIDDLNIENLDFEPTTLIVGTFNPSWPEGNQAEWFYGRTHDQYGNINNNFWDVLPRLYDEESLINVTHKEWKIFCKKHKIAITDLITSIEDANEDNVGHQQLLNGYADNVIAANFENHTFTDIVGILQGNPTIQNVYLTRGIGETFWRQLWRPVVQYANHNGLHENKLLTPSGYAFYQHGKYNNQNPNNAIPLLNDFILNRWQNLWHFREEN